MAMKKNFLKLSSNKSFVIVNFTRKTNDTGIIEHCILEVNKQHEDIN